METEVQDPIIAIAEEEMARIEAEKASKDGDTKKAEDANKTEGSDADSQVPGEEKVNLGADGNEIKAEEKEEGNEETQDESNELNKDDTIPDKTKEKINKEFARITKKGKEERAALTNQIAELKEQIAQQKKDIDTRLDPPEQKVEAIVKKTLLENKAKYLDADKEKDLADRREMTNEDLEQWLMDDPVAAHDWMLDRKLRYKEETARLFDKEMAKLTEPDAEEAAQAARAENKRIALENKDVDFIAKSIELSQKGKSGAEIMPILQAEFPLLKELEAKNPEKYLVPNGLLLMINDYREAKKSGKTKGSVSETEAERLRREGAIAERKRLESIDEGIGSEVGKEGSSSLSLTDAEKSAAKAAGMTEEAYIKAKTRQRKESGGY